MADPDGGGGVLEPFPKPPAYLWQQFTEENVSRLQALRQAHEDETGKKLPSPAVVPDVPEELEFLQPPPLPPSGRWRIFGQLHELSDRLPTLEEQGLTRLGAPIPADAAEKDAYASRVFALRKLAKSLLLNFLELTGILGTSPADAAAKLDDLQTIFYNMHHLINEWRPHQTREALIGLLQSQLEHTRNQTRALHEVTDSVRKTLVGLAGVGGEGGSEGGGRKTAWSTGLDATPGAAGSGAEADKPATETATEPERLREVWAALDTTFG